MKKALEDMMVVEFNDGSLGAIVGNKILTEYG